MCHPAAEGRLLPARGKWGLQHANSRRAVYVLSGLLHHSTPLSSCTLLKVVTPGKAVLSCGDCLRRVPQAEAAHPSRKAQHAAAPKPPVRLKGPGDLERAQIMRTLPADYWGLPPCIKVCQLQRMTESEQPMPALGLRCVHFYACQQMLDSSTQAPKAGLGISPSTCLQQKTIQVLSLACAVQAAILAALCNGLLDTRAVREEIDRREAQGLWVAGAGGVNGAFPMRSRQTHARRAKAERAEGEVRHPAACLRCLQMSTASIAYCLAAGVLLMMSLLFVPE